MVLIDGKYVGDLSAPRDVTSTVLKDVEISAGTHRLTLISACTYGIWSRNMEFSLK